MRNKHLFLASGLFCLLLIASPTFAATQTTPTVDQTTTTINTIATQANAATPTYDGITVEQPTKPKNTFGHFWQTLKENLSLTFTFDPNKKAERAMKFADEHLLRAKAALESANKKTKENGQKELERASKLMEKVQVSQDKALQKPNAETEKLLKNRVAQEQKHQELLDEIEKAAGADHQADILPLREKFADKSQALVNTLNNDKIPEDVKAKLQELKTTIDAHRAEIKDTVTQIQSLKDAAKSGDEEAQKKLDELKAQRLEEVKKAIEARQEGLQSLQEKMDSLKEAADKGNQRAADVIKKIQDMPALQQKLEEVEKKIQEHQQEPEDKPETEKEMKKERRPRPIRVGEPNPSGTVTPVPEVKQPEAPEVKPTETEKLEQERN